MTPHVVSSLLRKCSRDGLKTVDGRKGFQASPRGGARSRRHWTPPRRLAGGLIEQPQPCEAGVVSACLCKSTGHIAIVNAKLITFFDPLLLTITQTMTIPEAPDGARYQKLQASPDGEILLLGR